MRGERRQRSSMALLTDEQLCPLRTRRESYLSVDAGLVGNIARFFNHSCDPNLRQHYVWHSRNLDFARPHACFFTARDVGPREELRFSYAAMPEPGEAERIKAVLGDSRRRTLVEGRTVYQRCHCGESACMGIMFAEAPTEGAAQCAAEKQEAAAEEEEEKERDDMRRRREVSATASAASGSGSNSGSASIDRERDRVSASRSRGNSAGGGDVEMEDAEDDERGSRSASSRASTTSGPSRVANGAPPPGRRRGGGSGRGRVAPKSTSPDDDWYIDMSGD